MTTIVTIRCRRRLEIQGQVQGVGFRPCIVRMARELGLAGFVTNDTRGVVIEIEGPLNAVERFTTALPASLPPLASIAHMRATACETLGECGFAVRASRTVGERRAGVTPDTATCADCLREIHDPSDRRYHYALTNCTNCGPRYSIIRAIPYDRPATTMAAFDLCPACAREYGDIADRRYHAQPVACPRCGPRLRLVNAGQVAWSGDPIATAAALLHAGRVIAIKGLGGFHIACDANNAAAVATLRERKLRDGKPLAVMVADIDVAERLCALSPADKAALISGAAPIVLARRLPEAEVADNVAPGCADLGIMLPYTPLHHLLMREAPPALVMTSGNLAGQPLTYCDGAALRELADVADAFLLHDRDIFRPIDDSVVFTVGGRTVPVRRARGYVPRAIELPAPDGKHAPIRILAMGGELKSTVCLLADRRAIVSEHLGDLSTPQAYRHFVESIPRLSALYDFEADVVAHDMHPDYQSTHYAAGLDRPLVAVQHHHAHIASVMAEANEPGPLIGIACDGTGFGPDGAVWGCEVLRCEGGNFERLGHMEYFPLVGGDAAAIETWRPAAALLAQVYGGRWREWIGDSLPKVAARVELAAGRGVKNFEVQRRARLHAPPTSSLGRVFDAAAFLLGLCDRNRHEAQAAMALEAAAGAWCMPVEALPFFAAPGRDGIRLSLAPAFAALCEGVEAGAAAPMLAAQFHETVARALAKAGAMAAASAGVKTVALSGGCFLNRILLARLTALLEAEGLRVLSNHEVPPGDGGISLGQAYVAMWASDRATHA
jgi:hydrogenase maturation protein HypF